jgi:Flp pilus assembly protein TadG
MKEQRSRKGATLVMVAIMTTVLVGFLGVSIDASRLYVMRAQLQTTADASAIAAVVEVKNKRPTNATALAQQYGAQNLVERTAATVNAADVEPGTWNFATNSFTPLASWTDPAVAAVRVTARYPGAYTFARVFGGTGQMVTARAVGAIGYVSTTSCLKPWAVSYQTMLDALYPPANTKNGTQPNEYQLTAQDITTLSGMSSPANLITLLNGTNNQLTNGNIAQVQTYSGNANNAAYKAAIAGTTCPDLPIGPGTWLNGDPGAGAGQTANALKTLCGVNGNGNNGFDCTSLPKVKLAIWDNNNGVNGAGLKVQVKYVGVFTITRFDPGTGPGQPPDQIKGYFTSMATDGSFSGTPSPTTGSIALVQ